MGEQIMNSRSVLSLDLQMKDGMLEYNRAMKRFQLLNDKCMHCLHRLDLRTMTLIREITIFCDSLL